MPLGRNPDRLHNKPMKILLVSPESCVWNSRTHIHNGLGYLAGALIHAGYHAVDIFDGAVERESLAERLAREPFDIVGISSPTPLIHAAWQAAQTAKAHGAQTILGGPHPTLMPDESLQQPAVDFVARGEAEETLIEFVRALEARTPVSQIRGLSYRDAAGQVQHNLPRPLCADLNRIASPAYPLAIARRAQGLTAK